MSARLRAMVHAGVPALALAVAFTGAAASCGDDGGGLAAPPCSRDGGAELFDDYATCGSCTVVHGAGECEDGYTCTCQHLCTWWVNGFPFDGGLGCSSGDAGP